MASRFSAQSIMELICGHFAMVVRISIPQCFASHLYHSAVILEYVGNKGFVFELSLHDQPHTKWEARLARSFVWTLRDMGRYDVLIVENASQLACASSRVIFVCIWCIYIEIYSRLQFYLFLHNARCLLNSFMSAWTMHFEMLWGHTKIFDS